MFFRGSRYENVETDSISNDRGQVVRFKKVRFIDDSPSRVAVVVNQGERLDHLAFRTYQDPEIFWRICDANLAMWPPDLVSEPGRILKIPPSEG